jgi:hypothetical protein
MYLRVLHLFAVAGCIPASEASKVEQLLASPAGPSFGTSPAFGLANDGTDSEDDEALAH